MRPATPSSLPTCLLTGIVIAASSAFGAIHIEEIHVNRPSFDARVGSIAPSPAAIATVDALGGVARFNRFGTVHTLFGPTGPLDALPAGEPAIAARQWIAAHRELFGLSLAGVDALALTRDATLVDSSARVLFFEQRIGDLPVGAEGLIKVAVVEGQILWVSSSSVGDAGSLAAPTLTPAQAWLAAAGGLGIQLPATALGTPQLDGDWTVFSVLGLAEPARVRSVALGIPGAGVVPAFETIVVDLRDGDLIGYTTFVDARSGQRVVGRNRVQQLANGGDGAAAPVQVEPYQGSFPPNQVGECGPCHGPFTADAGDSWDQMVVTAHQLAGGDITFAVYRDDATCSGAPILQQDLLTTPEQATVSPLAPGDYFVSVCPYDATTNPVAGEYAGTVSFQNDATPNQNPAWRFFPAYPSVDFSSADTRELGCWFEGGVGCDLSFAQGSSHAVTWDFVPTLGASSETTTGNAARSSEAWGAFLSGGGPYQPLVVPLDPADHRRYDFPWTNEWFESSCNPLVLGHSGGLRADADIDAAITNLFVLHNQVHDWAYQLGLRERQGAAQLSNFGATSAAEEHDFELGNAQAGALTGGWPAYQGRDNANQLTLNDGLPTMSNMYLWQTIGGAIYVPCVDGDFDAGVIAHEYGHLIQNRMVDPQNGLSGYLGRAMGESWSDLTAIEFLNGYSRVPVGNENPFAVGAYITDPQRGIRNYGMNDSELNFSDVGYDIVCETDAADDTCIAITQPHADSEIWSAINYDLRTLLMAKYDGRFPSNDAALQRRCADGVLPADQCPGNRRWAQILHDALLLMPSAPSMVDARDAYLVADMLRTLDPMLDWASNNHELWSVFAARGLGYGADAVDGDDFEPTPSFESPVHASSTIEFSLRSEDGGAPLVGEIYVGAYEARVSPIADTDPSTALAPRQVFTPGHYDLIARADGFGHYRFSISVEPDLHQRVDVWMPRNWASLASGATASGSGADHAELIDDTEATNWERTAAVGSIDLEQPAVTIQLAGSHKINRVQVSGMLEVALGELLQGRFSSLHGFRVKACNAALLNCSLPISYTTILDAPNAFPSAGLRPLVGDMTLRSFATTPISATHLIFEALHNKCTGTPSYHGYLGIPGNDDLDPNNGTDCRTGSAPLIGAKNRDVRAAELQAFGAAGRIEVGPLTQ